MKLKPFSDSVKRVFSDVMIHKQSFQLNGSFNDSYWAGDVDLYQMVSDVDADAVYDRIKQILKKYIFLELKIVEDDGTTTKIFNRDDINEDIFKNKSLTMVKLDFVIWLVYPIESSVIYDFDPQRKYPISEVINDMLNDIKNYKSVYKGVKRLNSIANLLGYRDMFQDVLQQTKYGALYLTNIRRDLLERIRSKLDPKEYQVLVDSLIEDKRRNMLKTRDFNDDLIQFLKKSINK